MFKSNCVKKLRFVILFIVLLVCIISGCSINFLKNDDSSYSKDDYPVNIQGTKINTQPSKVIVLSDSLADVVVSLGYEDQLIAKTEECDQSEIKLLENVGSKNNISIEKIKEINPDLIIDSGNLNDSQIQDLKNININVMNFDMAKNRVELEELYSELGSIFAGAKTGYNKGLKVINNIMLTLDDINRIIPTTDSSITACYIYEDGSFATGNMMSGKLIKLAGMLNIGEGDEDGEIDTEILNISNPDYIFYSNKYDINEIKGKIGLVEAVKNNNLYEMEDNLMLRQGESMIDAVSFMVEKVFPELAKNNSSSNYEEKNNSSTDVIEASNELPMSLSKNLVFGDANDSVLQMEKRLDELNYMPTKPNGTFDDKTVRAIKDFQFINNMVTTGQADENTLRILFSDYAIVRPDPARTK